MSKRELFAKTNEKTEKETEMSGECEVKENEREERRVGITELGALPH